MVKDGVTQCTRDILQVNFFNLWILILSARLIRDEIYIVEGLAFKVVKAFSCGSYEDSRSRVLVIVIGIDV